MAKEIPKYTNLQRSKTYIKKLEDWASNINHYLFGNPDSKYFPTNKAGDIILILKTENFYKPYIDKKWEGGGHVAQKKIITPRELELTTAKVLGRSDIPYYDSSESDLKLLCNDNEERYLKANNDAGDSFIFLPHPECKSNFQNLIEFLPHFHYIDSHKKRVEATCKLTETFFNLYKGL